MTTGQTRHFSAMVIPDDRLLYVEVLGAEPLMVTQAATLDRVPGQVEDLLRTWEALADDEELVLNVFYVTHRRGLAEALSLLGDRVAQHAESPAG